MKAPRNERVPRISKKMPLSPNSINILSDVEVKYSTSYILYTCLHNNKLRLKVFGSPTLFLKTLTQTKQSHWRLKL